MKLVSPFLLISLLAAAAVRRSVSVAGDEEGPRHLWFKWSTLCGFRCRKPMSA